MGLLEHDAFDVCFRFVRRAGEQRHRALILTASLEWIGRYVSRSVRYNVLIHWNAMKKSIAGAFPTN